jgi:type IV pilus assembly protein PilY1
MRPRARAPLALGVLAALVAASGSADAQVGSANVPLPNVLLLLDTSGSFEHMIDGSNPEDPSNNNTSVVPPQLANCEQAWQKGVPAVPNRWGHMMQALTGTVMNASGTAPFYSCVTMDRQTGPLPTAPAVANGLLPAAVTPANADGLDLQYGLRNPAGTFYYPYDSGYYLPFHRPVSAQTPPAPAYPSALPGGMCVYSPEGLPGAGVSGGVGLKNGGLGGSPTDFPTTGAIGTFLYDSYPIGAAMPGTLPTPNLGYSSNTQTCTFNQATDGIMDQASSLVRFGMMTFDNDPSAAVGMSSAAILANPGVANLSDNTAAATLSIVPSPYSPFAGQWSYDSVWSATAAAAGPAAPAPWASPSLGLPAGCSTGPQVFQVGARNPAAPPWEGRMIGFPDPNADVNAVGQANLQIQTAINSLRPYGATPTAGLMTAAEYYFWADPNGPSTPAGNASGTSDPYVANGCRPQYIILLTDGGPNLDLRTQCQGSPEPTPGGSATAASGLCPYQLPEDTASILANATAQDVQTNVKPGTPVFTYVIGFAVSGNVAGTDTGLANCAQLAATNQLAAQCFTGAGSTGGGPYSPTGTGTGAISLLPQQQNAPVGSGVADGGTATTTLESPCCSLQRIAVAGGTQHAYFADTPGDLEAALAAVIGDITGQLGSRTLPVAAPTVSYAASGPLTATFTSSFEAASCPAGDLSAAGTCSVPWQSSGPWSGDVVRQQYQCPTGAMPGMGGATPLTPPPASDDFAADLVAQNSGFRNFLFFNGYNTTTNLSTNSLTLRPWLNGWKSQAPSATTAAGGVITNSNGVQPPADGMDSFGVLPQGGVEINNFGANPNTLYSLLDGYSGTALAIQTDSCQDPATGAYLDQVSCANLALSFAMAQTSFPAGLPVGIPQSTAVTNLRNAYANGHDGTNIVPVTNRGSTGSNAPLGAILDSTPAVVAPPSAQVRDDSYQAFATATSGKTLTVASQPLRDTMLYVATVDGLLHAFDTTAGEATEGVPGAVAANQVESWAFVPPAVLPRLISNYPGASNVLLDGSPVVKDVVFSRCQTGAQCGTPSSGWVQTWHTMLVAGFGLGGRGYYALDVTDPRPPTSTGTAPTYSPPVFPSYVSGTTNAPGYLGQSNGGPIGPHFQWQITSVNTSGNTSLPTSFVPTEIFGKISGTPAIATVYADPTLVLPGSAGLVPQPQEIGVAILPGGHDGLPTEGLLCTRELAAFPGNYSTSSPVWAAGGGSAVALPGQSPFNVADVAFPPRNNVRGWAQNCVGSNSAVPGRSVMVVSVATGQILAVFARHSPTITWPATATATADPTAWDVPSDGTGKPLINADYLIPTPLDSPMTGKPVVYPSGVGVVAQAAFIGDADGTLWRFDLSDPNPKNWTGAIFADAYSATADTTGTASPGSSPTYVPATDWTALDSQSIAVEPEIALDTSANVVVNFATGDQTAFNPCYSALSNGKPIAGGLANANCNVGAGLHPVANFMYSVKEVTGTQTGSNTTTPYHASVNWYYPFSTTSPGERVTGPMAVFNGILYFATYAPGVGTTASCSGGGPNLYAWDFEVPNPAAGATHSQGGNIGVDPNFPTGELTTSQLVTEYTAAVIQNTTIIPGVSVASTPSCTITASAASDAYTGGSHTVTSPPTPGNYSLMANLGKGSKHGAASSNLLTKQIQPPVAPTVVDSWAAVAE